MKRSRSVLAALVTGAGVLVAQDAAPAAGPPALTGVVGLIFVALMLVLAAFAAKRRTGDPTFTTSDQKVGSRVRG